MRRVLLLIWWVALSLARGATFQEDFSSDPQARGWQALGCTNLFYWDATNQVLEVTWDSSQSNSCFCRPLGTILSKSDDFSFEFDLQLSSVAVGVNPDKPDTFEVVAGLLNLGSATNSSLERGVGVNAHHGPRNLAEFDYFPDSGYGATISPTLVSSSNQFATSFTFPLALDAGALFKIALSYTASNRTLLTTMTRNGQAFGSVRKVVLGATFSDFRLDHFAVSSYSDAGADGSLLAQGVVDNVILTTPPPPVGTLLGEFTNGVWQVSFLSVTNWVYTLEQTGELTGWRAVSTPTPGNGALLWLQDTNSPATQAFYRVSAVRP